MSSAKPKATSTTTDIVVKPSSAEQLESAATHHGIDFKKLLAKLPAGASIDEAVAELGKVDPVIWTMINRRLKRHPLTFDMTKFLSKPENQFDKQLLIRHRPFLMQPLRDQHPHKTYSKSRQMGISEVSITEVVHFLTTTPQKKWMYCFPREKQLLDFSNTRIASIFEETPTIAATLTGTNGSTAKELGQGSWLLLRSAWESNLGEGVDADGVTLDEKDRMKDGVENAFTESLSSSAYGFLREVSTPTLPGRGVDKSWRRSDQWLWLVKCVRCGLEQSVEYEDNIVQVKDVQLGAKELPDGAYVFACRKLSCRGPLDRLAGRWVCSKPEVKLIRGYSITQLMAPWISATKIMQKKLDMPFVQLWENYVLGRVSRGESILVTDADFDQSCSNYRMYSRRTSDWEKVAVGIDWGATNWFYVLGKNKHNNLVYLLSIGIIEEDAKDSLNMREVIDFLKPFDPDIIVADAGYGRDRNAVLLRYFDPNNLGKFFACNYNANSKGSRTFKPVWGDARVLVDRTITLKSFCRAVKDRMIGFPGGDQKFELFKTHMKALAPLKEQEEDDGDVFETIVSTGDDHLAHAGAYAFLGMEKLLDTGTFSFDFL